MKNEKLLVPGFTNENYVKAHKYVLREKLLQAAKMVIVIIISLVIGFMAGKRYVIMNQCITSDDCQQGEYISILDDDVNVYWYE